MLRMDVCVPESLLPQVGTTNTNKQNKKTSHTICLGNKCDRRSGAQLVYAQWHIRHISRPRKSVHVGSFIWCLSDGRAEWVASESCPEGHIKNKHIFLQPSTRKKTSLSSDSPFGSTIWHKSRRRQRRRFPYLAEVPNGLVPADVMKTTPKLCTHRIRAPHVCMFVWAHMLCSSNWVRAYVWPFGRRARQGKLTIRVRKLCSPFIGQAPNRTSESNDARRPENLNKGNVKLLWAGGFIISQFSIVGYVRLALCIHLCLPSKLIQDKYGRICLYK